MTLYFTYILFSKKDGFFYIGFTRDVYRRLNQHNNGLNKSTKGRRPFLLVYFEAHWSKEDAKRREKYFKSSPGKRTLRMMLRGTLNELNTLVIQFQ